MSGKHSVRQQLTKFGLGPAVHDAMNDAMQVGAGIHIVCNAGRDDGQDIAGALSAFIEPCEKPIASPQHQTSELALSSIVGGFDIAVVEKEQESRPLASQVAQALA